MEIAFSLAKNHGLSVLVLLALLFSYVGDTRRTDSLLQVIFEQNALLRQEMLNGFSELRESHNELRREFRGELRDLRGELNGLRGELNGLRGEFSEFRAEMYRELTDIRGEITGMVERLTRVETLLDLLSAAFGGNSNLYADEPD